jgi:WhiB family redox-sensing transcriptional regulator
MSEGNPKVREMDTTFLREQAACRGHNPDIFFPEDFGTPDHKKKVKLAKSICSYCPVIEKCYNHALKHEDYGIWGGTTAAERIRIRDASN